MLGMVNIIFEVIVGIIYYIIGLVGSSIYIIIYCFCNGGFSVLYSIYIFLVVISSYLVYCICLFFYVGCSLVVIFSGSILQFRMYMVVFVVI